jgi:hypothetical protein
MIARDFFRRGRTNDARIISVAQFGDIGNARVLRLPTMRDYFLWRNLETLAPLAFCSYKVSVVNF